MIHFNPAFTRASHNSYSLKTYRLSGKFPVGPCSFSACIMQRWERACAVSSRKIRQTIVHRKPLSFPAWLWTEMPSFCSHSPLKPCQSATIGTWFFCSNIYETLALSLTLDPDSLPTTKRNYMKTYWYLCKQMDHIMCSVESNTPNEERNLCSPLNVQWEILRWFGESW